MLDRMSKTVTCSSPKKSRTISVPAIETTMTPVKQPNIFILRTITGKCNTRMEMRSQNGDSRTEPGAIEKANMPKYIMINSKITNILAANLVKTIAITIFLMLKRSMNFADRQLSRDKEVRLFKQ